MKKWFPVLAVILASSAFCASDPERSEVLSSKAILQNKKGYFSLADGSCWKAIGFATRWRSLSEWWNGVELVPQNYECVPNDWALGSQIEAYSKYDNLRVNEADASNQDELKQCTHLLVNRRTGQILFAIQLHPADCIVQVFNDALEDGYNKGYDKGRLASYANANEVYNNGHKEGYKVGFAEGYQSAIRGEPLR